MAVQGHLLPLQNHNLLHGWGKSGPCWKVRRLAKSTWDHLQHPLHLQGKQGNISLRIQEQVLCTTSISTQCWGHPEPFKQKKKEEKTFSNLSPKFLFYIYSLLAVKYKKILNSSMSQLPLYYFLSFFLSSEVYITH
jgi:hypothetical protein